MPTNYQIKFLKQEWGLIGTTPNVIGSSTANPYAICFDTTTKQIYVGGVAYGGAISDANYANGVLTITKSNGTTQTLDFNDVASAEATLKVFAHMNELMGVTQVGTTTELSYSGTEYLTLATTLVGADKALDAQIKAINDTIGSMDATNVQGVTATTTGNVIELTFKGVSETDGKIAQGTGTDTVTFAKVAKTGKAIDVAVDDTLDVFTGTNVEDVLLELSSKITNSNLTIDGHKGSITSDTNTMVPVAADGGKIGVKTDNVYIGSSASGVTLLHVDTNASSTTGSDLATVNTVTAHISTAIDALDVTALEVGTTVANEIRINKVKEDDGKISLDGYTSIPVDGTISDSNKLVTQSSIGSAIEDLDVTGYAQASVSNDEIKIYGIKEEDGEISHDTDTDVTIKLGSNYDATSNKVALQSNITDEINKLDVDTVQAVTYTAASGDNGAKLTFTGIKEEDGKIAVGTGNTNLQFAKVATTGKAEDVIVDTTTLYLGSTVDEAILSIDSRIKDLEDLPKFDVQVVESLPANPGEKNMHIIYLMAEQGQAQNDIYGEYIVLRSGTQGNYTYSYEKLGTTSASLQGYVKTVTVNGKDFTVGTDATAVNLGDSITSITNADGSITEGNGFTHDYVDTEVTVISTKDTTNGTYAASVISTATVKVQAVETAGDNAKGLAEASDVKAYVGTQISNLNVNSTTVGTNVKVTYSETNGIVTINTTEEYANVGNDLVVTDGTKLVTGDDITKVKNYIGSRVQDLNVNETPVTGTNVSFKYKETNGIVEIGTLVVDYATVTGGTTDNPSITVGNGTGLVTGNDISTIKTYVNDKISTVVDSLDADVTSDDAAVATVEVVEANGVITDVIVTNINAGVTYTAAGEDTNVNLTFSTATGAVTGNDITAIKNYIDAKATEASAVTSADATMTVNDSNLTTLGTVAGTPIQAKTQLVWDVYEDPQP